MTASSSAVLVTGVAGFIGFHFARSLLGLGVPVVGVDNLTPYYDPALKRARLAELDGAPGFRFEALDLADRTAAAALFAELRPQRVVHLAAQAGVRYSLEAPMAYVDANLTGTASVLEGCRHHGCRHLVFASTSSVYGGNTKLPFKETDPVDHPVSLYAATKRANELMAHTYAHLYGLPATGLRFFTVYGPWGRPDMAYFSFAEAIRAGRPIRLFNHGAMRRDFTYVDDVVAAMVRLLDAPPAAADRRAPDRSSAPFRLYNIGNHSPVPLRDFLAILEDRLGARAIVEEAPMQPGDVEATFADVEALRTAVGFAPTTPLADGLTRFVDWFDAWSARR
ncbi:MAG: NAD-dependent epimerase/dehydratase family protein [Alphaproteobacteria bacterium]